MGILSSIGGAFQSVFGGGSSTTTAKSTTEPWKPIQPMLETAAGDAMSAYQTGQFDIQPYTGTRVAPQSGLTTGAQGAMSGILAGPDPFLDTAGGAYPGLFNFMPQSWLTQAGQMGVAQTATGYNPVRAGGMYAFGKALEGPEAGLGGLDTARAMLSRFDGQPGAQLDELKANVLADVIPSAAHLFSSSGMLDSSMAADTVGRAAAGAIAPIEYGAWENSQNRALEAFRAASGMEQGSYESARARQMGAMDQTPSMMAARYIDPIMAMQAGGVTDQFMSSERDRMAGLIPTAGVLSASRYAGPQAVQGAGLLQDSYAQAQADAQMSQYYEGQQAPYNEQQRIASLLMGYGGMGGTGTAAQKDPGGGTMETIGNMAQIAALFAGSDRRLKTNIERIGETREGYPKYTFRYHWDEPDTVRIGVMADEVPPEITAMHPSGYMMVNYAEVTL